MNPVASILDDDEWELRNDDGFIYKFKRRRLTDPPLPADDKPAVNPEEEEKRRKERRRKTLLKLIERYQREIDEWEKLSNALSALQEKAQRYQIQQQQREEDRTAESLSSTSNSECKGVSGSPIDELLAQVEVQEAIIGDVSNLCDVAEAMCNAEEDRFKQSYFDLPIWASPLDLMASLCDQ